MVGKVARTCQLAKFRSEFKKNNLFFLCVFSCVKFDGSVLISSVKCSTSYCDVYFVNIDPILVENCNKWLAILTSHSVGCIKQVFYLREDNLV